MTLEQKEEGHLRGLFHMTRIGPLTEADYQWIARVEAGRLRAEAQRLQTRTPQTNE